MPARGADFISQVIVSTFRCTVSSGTTTMATFGQTRHVLSLHSTEGSFVQKHLQVLLPRSNSFHGFFGAVTNHIQFSRVVQAVTPARQLCSLVALKRVHEDLLLNSSSRLSLKVVLTVRVRKKLY